MYRSQDDYYTDNIVPTKPHSWASASAYGGESIKPSLGRNRVSISPSYTSVTTPGTEPLSSYFPETFLGGEDAVTIDGVPQTGDYLAVGEDLRPVHLRWATIPDTMPFYQALQLQVPSDQDPVGSQRTEPRPAAPSYVAAPVLDSELSNFKQAKVGFMPDRVPPSYAPAPNFESGTIKIKNQTADTAQAPGTPVSEAAAAGPEDVALTWMATPKPGGDYAVRAPVYVVSPAYAEGEEVALNWMNTPKPDANYAASRSSSTNSVHFAPPPPAVTPAKVVAAPVPATPAASKQPRKIVVRGTTREDGDDFGHFVKSNKVNTEPPSMRPLSEYGGPTPSFAPMGATYDEPNF